MFMCVLVYYVYIIFLAPSRLNRRASFHPPQRQEHIQDVIESTTGPTSKWCKDVAQTPENVPWHKSGECRNIWFPL